MYVNMLDYTSGKKVIMAVIHVIDGVVQIDGTVPPRIMDEIRAAKQRVPEGDAFLRSLPKNFSGSYIRAQLVRD